MSVALVITELKYSQAAESELRLKLRFERKLYGVLREAFRTQVRNFIRAYGLLGQVPSLISDIDAFTVMLNAHYLIVADKFANRLRAQMPSGLEMTSEESIALSVALRKIFTARADQQSRFINKTTLNLMDRSIRFAMKSVEAVGGAFNRMNVATSAGMLLNARMLARVRGIATYETQWAAEFSKQAEAMILVGENPSIKAKKKTKGIKQWDAMGDSRMRDWHADADGIQVALDQPYKVNYEFLMQPGDTSLGATPSNVIHCRCSSNIKVSSIIGARQDLDTFIPTADLRIPIPGSTQKPLGIFADAETESVLSGIKVPKAKIIKPKKPKVAKTPKIPKPKVTPAPARVPTRVRAPAPKPARARLKKVKPKQKAKVNKPLGKASGDMQAYNVGQQIGGLNPEASSHVGRWGSYWQNSKYRAAHKEAISEYVESSSVVNLAARAIPKAKWKPNIAETINNLDEAMGKSPLRGEATLFRGLKKQTRYKKFKPGDIFTDEGFQSWSIGPDEALEFASASANKKGMMIRVRVPKGQKSIYVDRSELEIIMPRGTKYRVVEWEKNIDQGSWGKMDYLTVEMVP